MTRRMIDSSMWSNENFAALPSMARLLQIGMINHADDQGRVKANPMFLSKEVFPYDRVTPTNVTKWLEQIAINGTIILYSVEGKQYAQLTKWWEYQSLQYAAPSDYPAPPEWKDRIRRTATKGFIATHNWTLTNGVTVDDTCDERGKLLPPKPPEKPFLSNPKPPGINGESPPRQSPEDSPGSPPEPTNKLNLIELNLNEDQSTAANAAMPPPSSLPQCEILGPKALIADLRNRNFMYFDRDASRIATSLISDYGWTRVMAAADVAEKRHLEKIKAGTRGISSPMAYMRTVLDGSDEAARNGASNGNHSRSNQPDHQKPEATQYSMAEHQAHNAQTIADGRPY